MDESHLARMDEVFTVPKSDPGSAGRILRVNQAPVVDVRGLHVRFGEVEAVAGIDLEAYAVRVAPSSSIWKK